MILSRYLWRAVLIPSLAVLVVLLSLDVLFSFIAEIEGLRGDYQAWQALQFVLTTLPRRAFLFLPMGILLGTLLGLGMLANSGELTVMRAAGLSTSRISWLVIRPGLVLLFAGFILGEFVAPYTEQIAQSNRAVAEGGGETLRSRYGYWHREGNEFVHIDAIQPNGVLYGVTRYRFDSEHRLQETTFFDRAIYQGGSWFVEGVKGSLLQEDRVTAFSRPTDTWISGLSPEMLSIVVLKPEHLALTRLLEYARYLRNQGLESAEYMLSFWQKIMMPVATVGMILIAVSFIFGPLRQVSVGLRLTAGIMAGLLFHYGQQFVGHVSLVFDVAPLVAGVIPALICVGLGLGILARVR